MDYDYDENEQFAYDLSVREIVIYTKIDNGQLKIFDGVSHENYLRNE